MKIRHDFVTNSSSSSFVISKDVLSKAQIKAIHNHCSLGEKLGILYSDYEWKITESDTWIAGETSMGNFDMSEFLEMIDVRNPVQWDVDFDDMYKFPKYEKSNWESLLNEVEEDKANDYES